MKGNPTYIGQTLHTIADLFHTHHIEFAVVGALSLGMRAKPRYTHDIDVLVHPWFFDWGPGSRLHLCAKPKAPLCVALCPAGDWTWFLSSEASEQVWQKQVCQARHLSRHTCSCVAVAGSIGRSLSLRVRLRMTPHRGHRVRDGFSDLSFRANASRAGPENQAENCS